MVDITVQTHEIIYEIVKIEIVAQEYIFVISNCSLEGCFASIVLCARPRG